MQTVISAFDDYQTAQRAAERLIETGFDRDDVHVQQGVSTGSASMAGAATTTTGAASTQYRDEDRGILASIGHFFASLFGEDDDNMRRTGTYTGQAGTYSEAVKRGSSVVVIDAQTEEQADRAADLMQEMGAIDVNERAEQWRQSGWKGYEADSDTVLAGGATPSTMNTQQNLRDATTGQEGVMEVVQEDMQVGKRTVDRGGVRVIQRVSEKPVRELIRLREERAVVDRRAVDRPATAADLSNFKEGSIEVRETSEEAVVAKNARVVEEVRVGKDVQEREETIEDTVRRKDVDVERLEGEGRTSMERERAVASDRTFDAESDVNRDPESSGTSLTGRKTLKKPRNS